MAGNNHKTVHIILRYLALIILALSGLYIFYFIFTPLTIYPVYLILSLFYPVYLSASEISIKDAVISLAPACIAGSAYFLLVSLNLSVSMPLKKRVFSLIFSLSAFLIINILRIVLFLVLLVNSFQYFDITHQLFWFFLSGVFVFLIWILTIKIYRIKEIPFYTDLKFIYDSAETSRNKRRK